MLQVCSLLHQRYAEFGAELFASLLHLFSPAAKGAVGAHASWAACSLERCKRSLEYVQAKPGHLKRELDV